MNETTRVPNKEAAVALSRARASMYRFLGGLYTMEVDKAQMYRLKRMTFPEVTGTGDADQDLREGYVLLRGYLAEFPEVDAGTEAKTAAEGTAASVAAGHHAAAEIVGKAGAPADKPEAEAKLDDLAADYAKIFLAAGDATGRAAFPYESVYVDKRHRTGGSTEMQMHALYLERGLTADPAAYRTMDDNIGLMLEYQGNVCEELTAALEAEDTEKAAALLEEQKAFVKKHLTNWVYSFTADVARYADRDFYKGVAKITSGFIKKEAELLKKGAGAWGIA